MWCLAAQPAERESDNCLRRILCDLFSHGSRSDLGLQVVIICQRKKRFSPPHHHSTEFISLTNIFIYGNTGITAEI